jgi:hypothetical protein
MVIFSYTNQSAHTYLGVKIMATVKPKWEEFVVGNSSFFANDGFTLRHRVESKGETAVDVWQRYTYTSIDFDDSLENVLELLAEMGKGLVDPYVSRDLIMGTYGDDDYYEVRVTGWVSTVTPEQIEKAKQAKKDKAEADAERERERAERDLERIRKTHPDLLK